MRFFSLLFLILLFTAAACQTTPRPRGGLTWSGNAEPPPEQSRQPDTHPPDASQPDVRQPDTRRPSPTAINAPAIRLLDREPRRDPSALPSLLTGENKPNGPAMRFRQDVPKLTPLSIPRETNGLELFIAEEVPEGWLAFYKGRCGSLGDVCNYRAILFTENGAQRWNLDLNRYLQGSRYVEIQDVRYQDGLLYFNEACATYSGEVQGQCSWLVALDPVFQEVEWRTPPLTSNNIFILHDDILIAGYGFTAEPDAVYLINARSGEIRAQAELDSAPQYLEVQGGRLYVVTYQSLYTFAL